MASGWVEGTEAVLNAVLGDYLERRGNGLAIEMGFYEGGARLSLSPDALCAAHPRIGPRIVVLVHGMAQTEACWSFAGHPGRSYGTLLEKELALTPFYVRYNSGRHISENGKELAALLEQLVRAFPVPVEEITLIGHSMGGLLIRSACHYAAELGLSWMRSVHRAFYLGSPHLGAPLEKAGHAASVALGAIDNPVVRLTHAIANLRSAGVKDLRHGSLLDEHWPDDDVRAFTDPPPALPLCAGVEHYLIAGTLTGRENHLVARLFGDGLVRLASATGPGQRGALIADHVAVVPGVHHPELAHSPEVYARIRAWLAPASLDAPPDAEPASTADAPSREAPTNETLGRAQAYVALLQDAVDHGATAIQEVHEELAAGPYDWIERVPALGAPARLVRTAHFAVVRHAYDMTRLVNRVAGAVVREGIELFKRD